MVRIFILEDDEKSREALCKILESYSAQIEIRTASTLTEAEGLLAKKEQYDLFLLDIQLDVSKDDDKSGIVFAKEIRMQERYQFVPIVMITSIASLELDAYRELHCYQYILKPFEPQTVLELTDKIIRHTEQIEDSSIVVKKEGINYRIACKDIVYINAIPRGICLNLKKERLEVPYLSIKQILQKLPDEEFIQCHRMYVMNKHYIDYVDFVNRIIQMRGYTEPLEIGVTYKTELRSKIHA